jgi:hypothetical protein
MPEAGPQSRSAKSTEWTLGENLLS